MSIIYHSKKLLLVKWPKFLLLIDFYKTFYYILQVTYGVPKLKLKTYFATISFYDHNKPSLIDKNINKLRFFGKCLLGHHYLHIIFSWKCTTTIIHAARDKQIPLCTNNISQSRLYCKFARRVFATYNGFKYYSTIVLQA